MPIFSAMWLQGTYTTSQSSRLDFSSMMLLLTSSSPPGLTSLWNLSMEGRFMASTVSAMEISGEATGLSETTTEQLAVPPRISGP